MCVRLASDVARRTERSAPARLNLVLGPHGFIFALFAESENGPVCKFIEFEQWVIFSWVVGVGIGIQSYWINERFRNEYFK